MRKYEELQSQIDDLVRKSHGARDAYDGIRSRLDRLEEEGLYRPYPKEDLLVCPVCGDVMKLMCGSSTANPTSVLYWHLCPTCQLRMGERDSAACAKDDVRKLCGRPK